MGTLVGETDGLSVGNAVGARVGAPVGDKDGPAVGNAVGTRLGAGTGARLGMAVGAMELAFVENGLVSMQAGGFDREAFAAAVELPNHMVAVSLLAVGRLPQGQKAPSTKERKALKDIAFRVGDTLR